MWTEFKIESMPKPLVPVLLYIVDGIGNYTIMSGHITPRNTPRVFDLFSKKFKAIPKTFKVTQWYEQI